MTYSYTKESIKNFLQGMTVRNVAIDHIFPYSISEYTRYEYKKVWYFSMLPDGLFRKLEQYIGWHLCVDAEISG